MRALAVIVAMLILAGCGFHLRTAQEDHLPPRFANLRVTMSGSGLRYPKVVLVMRRMLRDHGASVFSGQVPLPTLALMGETLTPVVVSINNSGGAAAYLLDYTLSFVLLDAKGRAILGPETIRVQREYNFNPLNILSMAREKRYIENRMRRSAARQIVARIIAFGRRQSAARAEYPSAPPPPFTTRHAH